MNNKDIEKNILNAFNKIQPNQLDSILSDCAKQEKRMIIVQETTTKNNWMPRVLSLAAAVVLTVGLITGITYLNKPKDTIAATILLDVNPSIDIKINKNEKVVDVTAMNKDAEKVVGDMDFKGSDLKVTVNALIGSLVRNGYINDVTNSILVSVEGEDELAADSLEEKLLNEISNLLNKGSVLAQKVNADEDVRRIAEEYGVSIGKAQLVKELAMKSTIYKYEDLVGLTINELNLLSKNLDNSSIQRNGNPSDKAYIGTRRAKEIALGNLGINENEANGLTIELDFDERKIVYEVEFTYNSIEYEYIIDALDGDILFIDKDNIRTSNYTPSNNTNNNNQYASDLIGEQRAKSVVLSNAGVNESQIRGYFIEKEYDDGVVKYEIKFYANGFEYEYELNARTGTIIKVEKEEDDDYYEYNASSTSQPSGNVYNYSGTTYVDQNGTVYELDDGKWEVEEDKKIENGITYEYDDGKWQPDSKTENGITYEYDDGEWQPDKKVENGVTYEFDDGKWEVDDDDDDD